MGLAKPEPTIPDKLYFKIGEVARLVGVQPYVLRYWESEFPLVRPNKTRSRHRLYRRRDVETLLEIKRLLHSERFTIEGARKRLKEMGRVGKRGPRPARVAATDGAQLSLPLTEQSYRQLLGRVRRELEALHKLLLR
jgi:DNA-binding transcriptional MerR regulator